jgi:hypothetical protein
VRADRQHRVEQQHALSGPGRQVAVRRRRLAEIVLQFSEDVDERRRQRLHVRSDRKAEAVRLAFARIRILAENQHADVFQRREIERGEDVRLGREDRVRLALLVEKRLQLGERRPRRLHGERGGPSGRNRRQHAQAPPILSGRYFPRRRFVEAFPCNASP